MKNIVVTLASLCLMVAAYGQNVGVPVDTLLPDSVHALTDSVAPTQVDTVNAAASVQSSPPPKIYKLCPWVDVPIVAATAAWSGFAFTKIYSKPSSTVDEIKNLNKNDVPKIDRWAAGMSSDAADAESNYFFYGSIPVPFLLFLDHKIRHDAGKISFMYLEAMSITGLFYTGSVYAVDRYRPETYDTSIPIEERMKGNYKDAFLAGHPALVATSLFFSAKVYADYNPHAAFRYVMYGIAIAGTGGTAYLRHLAGKHFPTDLATGITVGTLCGILVPQLHKHKNKKEEGLSFMPFFDKTARGISITYTY